jgi:hypothetical protein
LERHFRRRKWSPIEFFKKLMVVISRAAFEQQDNDKTQHQAGQGSGQMVVWERGTSRFMSWKAFVKRHECCLLKNSLLWHFKGVCQSRLEEFEKMKRFL